VRLVDFATVHASCCRHGQIEHVEHTLCSRPGRRLPVGSMIAPFSASGRQGSCPGDGCAARVSQTWET
jgi:hypothetical protein